MKAGTYSIKVTASNKGGSASATYNLTVNNLGPSFYSAPTNQTAVKGSAMGAYTAPAASDPNGDALSYSASGMPPGITFNASTRTFSGTPTATGTYTVTYTVSDGKLSTSKTFTITVNAPANQPPVYNGGIGTIFFNAGQYNSWTVPSTAFTNPTGRPLSYSITKSDGTALPSAYSFNSSTGTLTANLATHSGDYSIGVIIKATDTTDGTSASASTSIYVTGSGSGGGGGMMAVSSSTTSPSTSTQGGAQGGGHAATTQVTTTTTTTSSTTPNVQSYWFTYDAVSRPLSG